jgi:hypothetical protein
LDQFSVENWIEMIEGLIANARVTTGRRKFYSSEQKS